MSFASAALAVSLESKIPLLVTFAAIVFILSTSGLPFDFKRNRAFGGRPRVILNVVTSSSVQ